MNAVYRHIKVLRSMWLPTVILAALFACRSHDSRDGVMLSDSAGIHIVDNIYPAWRDAQRWRLSEAPTLHIGVEQGDSVYELYNVRAARRLRNGEMVVANAGTYELRFYDRDGRFLRATGRAGAGPGEFESLGRVFEIAPGSLLVTDMSLGRLSVFDTRGSFARSWSPADGVRLFIPLGHFSDGSVLLGAAVVLPEVEQQGIHRDMASYYLYNTDGSRIDSLGMFPFTERYFSSRPGGIITRISPPFARHACTAVGDTLLYVGIGERFEVAVYSRDGGLVRLQRFAKPATPVTEDHVEAYMAAQTERYRRYLDGVPVPATLPAYSRFVLDEPGNLWVEEFRPNEAQLSRWWVFENGGRLLGPVEISTDFRVEQIGDDYVIGVWQDDDGVEYVRSYDLNKPSR